MRISGRTPRTVSAPAAKRSLAAMIRFELSPESAVPLVADEAPFVWPFPPFIPSSLGCQEKRSRIE
jgi:hypothetical protein